MTKGSDKGPVYSNFPANTQKSKFYFAVHPLYNPSKLYKVYSPLIDYLNQYCSTQIILETSMDYQQFEDKILYKQPDILLPNPYQTLQAIKGGYHVIATAGDKEDFKGLFIVRKDNSILSHDEIRGKTISFPSYTALAACIMPEYYLFSNGINVRKDIHSIYVGSQESSIMSVYLRQAELGATWPSPWRAFQRDHPEEGKALKVLWETDCLISNSVMVKNDFPKELELLLQNALLSLSQTKEGDTILSTMDTHCFKKATNEDYLVVKDFIQCFEQQVHKIELE